MEAKFIVIAVIVGAIVILVGSLLGTSLKKLNSDEVGLKYDTIQKKLSRDPANEGLHAGPPGFQFIKFPSVFKTLQFGDLSCLNKDGVEIHLDVSFQYQVKANDLYEVVMQFRDHKGYEKILYAVGAASLHEACSMYNTSQFQSERGNFQETIRDILVERYNELKCDISDLQVNNIARPLAYEQAIKNKESAKENIKVAENERPRKLTQAETKRREAKTQAKITEEKANSDARIILAQAKAEAEAILDKYEKEAEAYEELISANGLNLNSEGFLSYIGVRTIASAKNPVYVGLKGPAKSSYVVP